MGKEIPSPRQHYPLFVQSFKFQCHGLAFAMPIAFGTVDGRNPDMFKTL